MTRPKPESGNSCGRWAPGYVLDFAGGRSGRLKEAPILEWDKQDVASAAGQVRREVLGNGDWALEVQMEGERLTITAIGEWLKVGSTSTGLEAVYWRSGELFSVSFSVLSVAERYRAKKGKLVGNDDLEIERERREGVDLRLKVKDFSGQPNFEVSEGVDCETKRRVEGKLAINPWGVVGDGYHYCLEGALGRLRSNYRTEVLADGVVFGLKLVDGRIFGDRVTRLIFPASFIAKAGDGEARLPTAREIADFLNSVQTNTKLFPVSQG